VSVLDCLADVRACVAGVQDFGSVRMPLDAVVSLIPPLRPRAFSIASSFDSSPGRLELCVAVVEYSTPRRRRKLVSWLCAVRAVYGGRVTVVRRVQGVCSSWIRRLGSTTAACDTVVPLRYGSVTGAMLTVDSTAALTRLPC
jgi:sulfite reductase alpha subunit-like flavoprotein